MGTMRFSEYADSPAILLPPQQHFQPSSYSHSVLPHQTPKPVMASVPYQSLFNAQTVDKTPADHSSLSRKRKFVESSQEDNPCQGTGMMAADIRRVPPPTGNGIEVPLVGTQFPIGSQVDMKPSNVSNGFGEKRCKASPQETAPNFSTTTNGSMEVVDKPETTSSESLPDKMSVELGVGWKSLSDHLDMQAAARGWAKYIEKHFYFKDVSFLARHTDQRSLIRAHDGFYVFTADLNHGTFVAEEWVDVVADLKWGSDFRPGLRGLLRPTETPGSGESGLATNAVDQRVESSSTESQADISSTLEQPPALPFACTVEPEMDVEMKIDG
ncbi:MAG: hypothetical protein Q9174_006099 [Haloplaca sp. 1 TL-2023]